jgi:hypothetical protein
MSRSRPICWNRAGWPAIAIVATHAKRSWIANRPGSFLPGQISRTESPPWPPYRCRVAAGTESEGQPGRPARWADLDLGGPRRAPLAKICPDWRAPACWAPRKRAASAELRFLAHLRIRTASARQSTRRPPAVRIPGTHRARHGHRPRHRAGPQVRRASERLMQRYYRPAAISDWSMNWCWANCASACCRRSTARPLTSASRAMPAFRLVGNLLDADETCSRPNPNCCWKPF